MYTDSLETGLKNKNEIGKFTRDISDHTAQGKQILKSNFQQFKENLSGGKLDLIQYCYILAKIIQFSTKNYETWKTKQSKNQESITQIQKNR